MRAKYRAPSVDRADKVVAALVPKVGRRRLAELFAQGAVRVNGRVAKKGDRVAVGDAIELAFMPATGTELAPVPEPDAPLEVLYRDSDIVAVNKPPGLPSHPLRAGEGGTLANRLVARFAECAGASRDPREAGLVHRLDTGTSGVIVAARSRDAWEALRAELGRHAVEKRYLALVHSATIDAGSCTMPLLRRGNRMEVAETAGAKGALAASTSWRVIERAGQYTLLECTTHTGRMHQVRVHLAYQGAPIAGDMQYGGPALPPPMAGHGLHASAIKFVLGSTGELHITSPLPVDRRALLDTANAAT
jgi:23S rRNA pseudouridine1911/1915/1917 synthase